MSSWGKNLFTSTNLKPSLGTRKCKKKKKKCSEKRSHTWMEARMTSPSFLTLRYYFFLFTLTPRALFPVDKSLNYSWQVYTSMLTPSRKKNKKKQRFLFRNDWKKFEKISRKLNHHRDCNDDLYNGMYMNIDGQIFIRISSMAIDSLWEKKYLKRKKWSANLES